MLRYAGSYIIHKCAIWKIVYECCQNTWSQISILQRQRLVLTHQRDETQCICITYVNHHWTGWGQYYRSRNVRKFPRSGTARYPRQPMHILFSVRSHGRMTSLQLGCLISFKNILPRFVSRSSYIPLLVCSLPKNGTENYCNNNAIAQTHPENAEHWHQSIAALATVNEHDISGIGSWTTCCA